MSVYVSPWDPPSTFFRNQKTLEEFDFSFNPNINRALITELASRRFLEE